MPIGASDGSFYEDDFDRVTGKNGNEGSGPESSRSSKSVGYSSSASSGDSSPSNGGTVASRMPLGGSQEPAGALKSEGGSQTPGKPSEINWEGYNQPFGTLKGTAPEDTPVAFKTPYMNITEGDIDRAIDVGMAAGPGTMAGVRSLRNLPKEEQLTRLINQRHAENLEGQGVHPDEIWTKTGWMRGPEGKWKYEIDDSKASFDKYWHEDKKSSLTDVRGGAEAKLSDVWDHPELFKTYPDMKNIKVIYDPRLQGAHYNSIEDSIHVGPRYNTQDTLAHEVQHAIQEREGFAKGGMAGTAGIDYSPNLAEDYAKWREKDKQRFSEINDKYQKRGALGLSEDDMNYLAHSKMVQDKYREYIAAANKEAVKNYGRLSGEVEARNVETRQLMTKEERRQVPPSATQDVPFTRQATKDIAVLATPYDYRDVYGRKVGKEDVKPHEE